MPSHNEEQIKKQIQDLTLMLGGKYNYQTVINTEGYRVKRIIIEYDEISESL
tara:strand:- start:169 stop:324 length:156 start_codon:yes stop_codon:yes gene_type:complete